MIGGFERYFQIARCFRDEDLRADRQPDFTQLDIEMSFVDTDDVIDLNERLLAFVLGRSGVEVELPMRRLPYDEAISRYGSDKPDLRFGLELHDLTEIFRGSEFNAFRQAIEGGALVRGLNAGKQEMSRADLDGLVAEATELGAKGLVWAVLEADGWRSPVAKFLSADEIARGERGARRERGGRRPAGRRRAAALGGGPRGAAAPAGRAPRADRSGGERTDLDRRLAAARLGGGRGALGPAQPPLHLA